MLTRVTGSTHRLVMHNSARKAHGEASSPRYVSTAHKVNGEASSPRYAHTVNREAYSPGVTTINVRTVIIVNSRLSVTFRQFCHYRQFCLFRQLMTVLTILTLTDRSHGNRLKEAPRGA